MTTADKSNRPQSTVDLLQAKYGLLMSLNDVAEVLKFPTVDSVRKALARETLRLSTIKLPNRRKIYIKTGDLAAYIDSGN